MNAIEKINAEREAVKEIKMLLCDDANSEFDVYEKIKEYITENEKVNKELTAMFEKYPEMGTIFLAVLNGEMTFRTALLRYINSDFFNIEEDSEEYVQLINAENEKLKELQTYDEKLKEQEENYNNAMKQVEAFCEDFNLNADEYTDDVLKYIYEPITTGKIDIMHLLAWKMAIDNTKLITDQVVENAYNIVQAEEKKQKEADRRNFNKAFIEYLATAGRNAFEQKKTQESLFNNIRNERLRGIIKKNIYAAQRYKK